MVKHTQTIRRQQPANCLSVLDHFAGLALNLKFHFHLTDRILQFNDMNTRTQKLTNNLDGAIP